MICLRGKEAISNNLTMDINISTVKYRNTHVSNKRRYFYVQFPPMVKYILKNDSIFQEIMVSMVILKVNANVHDAPLQELPCEGKHQRRSIARVHLS